MSYFKSPLRIQDLVDANASSPADGEVLGWDAGTGKWVPLAIGGGGQANTASNVGAGGVGLYDAKVGVDLQFRNINAASSKVTVALDAGNKEVDIDLGTVNLDDLADVVLTTPSDGYVLTYHAGSGTWIDAAPTGGGASALDDLTDVTITAIASGEVLKWNGSAWINNTLAEAGISATGHSHVLADVTDAGTLAGLNAIASLDDITDVTITANSSGEILKWNGSAWINNTLAEAGISATGHAHAASDITSGTLDNARVSAGNVTQHVASIDHDATLNFVANEHIDHTAVSISTATGLSGGGTIASTRTISLDINALTADASPVGSTDYVLTYDASASGHKKVLIDNLPGTPTAILDGDFSTNGLMTRTASGTYTSKTLTGTPNEISVADGDGVSANPTVSLPSTIDLGGKTSLEIPNSATPTVDADGEIAIDTTVTDFSHGIVKYFSGEELGVIAMPIAQFTSPTNNYVVTYDSTADEFQLKAAAGGGSMPEATIQFPFAALRVNTTLSFPPIDYTDLGTVEDYVRAFDDTTEEYVVGSFAVPNNINTSGTVTFEVWGKRSTGTSSANMAFTFGHRALADSEAMDGTYTDVDSGAMAVDTTSGDLDYFSWTASVSTLTWAANDLILFRISRDTATDTLTGDYHAWLFRIRIPQA